MKRLIAVFGLLFLFIGAILFVKETSLGAQLVWALTGGGQSLFPLISLAALIDSINPCAFSLLVITVGFLVSAGGLSRSRILAIGGAYIFGIFISYLGIGFSIFGALHLFNTPHFVGKIGAGALIAIGVLNLVKAAFPKIPLKLNFMPAFQGRMAELIDRATIPAAFALGIIVGLCEFPCTGGPYLMAIGMLHDSGTKLSGIGYLVWYNLLFVMPLLGTLVAASDKSVLEKVESWKKGNLKKVRFIEGILMILFGLAILIFS